jgi:hypothetical protein
LLGVEERLEFNSFFDELRSPPFEKVAKVLANFPYEFLKEVPLV